MYAATMELKKIKTMELPGLGDFSVRTLFRPFLPVEVEAR
jgi:hypothetical protein